MKVKTIRFAGVADVYNMEVADTHDFAVEGGVIVHNCYDELRYVCMKNPIAPRKNMAQELPEREDPLNQRQESAKLDRYAWLRMN